MPRLSKIPLLVALLAAAALVAPAAAVRLTPLNDLCVMYGAEECPDHADKCVTCHAWSKVDVCVETSVALKLPKKLFTCDFPPPPAPNTDCQSHTDEDSCSSAHHCVWCLSAAVPSACYTEEEAKRLPAAVFKCKFPSLAAQQ